MTVRKGGRVPTRQVGSGSLPLFYFVGLSNAGKDPIIFLIVESPSKFGAAIAETKEAFQTGKILAQAYGGPSRSRDPKWERLRKELDQLKPPSDYTRLLKAGESYTFQTSAGITVPLDPKKYSASDQNERLEVLEQLSPVWIKVFFQMWPFNLEPDLNARKLSFGHELQKRWSHSGYLWIEDISSEPMRLDLNGNSIRKD